MSWLRKLYDWATWKTTFDQMEAEDAALKELVAKVLEKKRKEAVMGHNWAKMSLESGAKTPEEVNALTDGAFDYTPFDKGARIALSQYLTEKGIEPTW